MQIQYRKASELKPYKSNPKKHPKDQIEGIAESIKRFGFIQPIVVDQNDTVIIGHGRLEAVQLLNGQADSIPVVKLESLTENEVRALRILDNKLNESEWNEELLQLELGEIDFEFEPYNVELENTEIQEDDFNPGPVDEIKTNINLGDIIELGRHRVMCGDSVQKLFFTSIIDLVITDPPYGVNHIGGTKDPRRKTHRTGGIIINDNLKSNEIKDIVTNSLSLAASQSKEGAVCYVACPPGTPLPVFINAFNAAGFVFMHSLVWVKHAFVFGRADYHYRHEIILYGWKEGAHYFCDDRSQDTVLEYDRGDKMIDHPTSKPLEMWGRLIKNSSRQGEVIYDPFLGSGTTLIACEQLNRTCYGMEICPQYCQVIVDRYQKYCADNSKPFECKINGAHYESLEAA